MAHTNTQWMNPLLDFAWEPDSDPPISEHTTLSLQEAAAGQHRTQWSSHTCAHKSACAQAQKTGIVFIRSYCRPLSRRKENEKGEKIKGRGRRKSQTVRVPCISPHTDVLA